MRLNKRRKKKAIKKSLKRNKKGLHSFRTRELNYLKSIAV